MLTSAKSDSATEAVNAAVLTFFYVLEKKNEAIRQTCVGHELVFGLSGGISKSTLISTA
jgi:hypothetical protein